MADLTNKLSGTAAAPATTETPVPAPTPTPDSAGETPKPVVQESIDASTQEANQLPEGQSRDSLGNIVETGATELDPASIPQIEQTVLVPPPIDVMTDEFDEEIYDPDAPRPIFQAYKHKMIREFQVDTFRFKDHILVIHDEEENNRFLALRRSLHPIDKNAIVKYNLQAVQSLESPIDDRRPISRGFRGPASTSTIKDSTTTRQK